MMATMQGEEIMSERLSVPRNRVLLVDDDLILQRTYGRVLRSWGFEVTFASTGVEALPLLRAGDFDVVLSDIAMPEMDGIALLQTMRREGYDVPVILMTGGGCLHTAKMAIAHGALRYINKPFDMAELREGLDFAAKQGRVSRAQRHCLTALHASQIGDLATLEVRFERALASLWVAFQPIVCWSQRKVFGYEALLRTREPSLPNPGAVIEAAEQLERLHELSRIIRAHVAAAANAAPIGSSLFVNLHTLDLLDDDLYSTESSLAPIAERVVFEITERHSFERIPDVEGRLAELRRLGYRIAVDDLGAGYAGLSSLVQLEPEVVKIDMTLVRDVDTSEFKQKLIRLLAAVCTDAGRLVVVEGIETVAEREVLTALGCDLHQGYLLARPGPGFPSVAW